MTISAQISLLSNKISPDEYVAEILKRSMAEDIYIQIGKVSALAIKGKMYDEKVGRIIQLRALNDSKIDIGGQLHTIISAKPSTTTYMSFDFEVARADGHGEPVSMELEYATVRKMIERKTASFDPDEDNSLLQELNDMHEDAFTINGKEYYIAGEEWTQSRPGCRDLILIPVGRTDNSQVIKSVPESLISKLIKTRQTSFNLDENGLEITISSAT